MNTRLDDEAAAHIRIALAAVAMHALIPRYASTPGLSVAEEAVMLADALLAALTCASQRSA